MNAITATWKNGQIRPDEPADWPDGCRLRIEPLDEQGALGMHEEDWSNTPEAISDWLSWYDSLEPLELTADEEAELEAWRRKAREFSVANVDKRVEDMFP